MIELDSRAWNLLVGLAVVAGCGGPASSDDDSDETSSVCKSGADCPEGHVCNEGVCEYVTPEGGDLECASDLECATLELCESDACQPVGSPPACEATLVSVPPFEISEPVLQIAFVDVDDDDADELIVATQTQLHVYETGATMPVSYPRDIESAEIQAMVGGAFDDMPGADVMVLHDDQLDLYASDGLGALAPAVSMPSPHLDTRGLTAGAFDTEPTTDLLLWGSFTAGLRYGSGEELDVLVGDITSGDARDLGLPGSGFTLLRNSELLFIDIEGSTIGSAYLRGTTPAAQTSIDVLGAPLEIVGSSVQGWTLIELYDRLDSSVTNRWGIPENNISHMRAGDLDGLDEMDDVALVVDGDLSVFLSNECLLPVPLDGPAVDVVLGDHDGDGDDELAVHTQTDVASSVLIVDVE
jgi:hypothetical protein